MDIDLAGQVNNQLDHIKEVVSTVCEVHVEPDGIAFNRTSIEVNRIKEDADYEGVRSSSTQRSREREFRCNSISDSAMSLLPDPRTLSTQAYSISLRRCYAPIP